MEVKNPSKDIIIINIEKRDRFELYQLINHIKQFKPKVIGLDIIFKDRKDPFVDSLLVSAVADKNIILSKAYVEGNWVYNHSLFKSEFNQVGYTNINFDRTNNVIRTFQGEKIIMDKTHYALSTQILKKYINDDSSLYLDKLLLNKPNYIDYLGNMDSFLTFSYEESFENDLSIIKDKIVLLGYLGTPHGSDTDIEDKLFTPLNNRIAGKSPPDMFGVLIHANIIEQVLKNNFFKETPKWLEISLTVILAFVSLLFFIFYIEKSPASFTFVKKIIQLLVTVLILWLSLWLFKKNILLKPEIITVVFIISIEMIGPYKIIANKLNTKYKWKSYFFQS